MKVQEVFAFPVYFCDWSISNPVDINFFQTFDLKNEILSLSSVNVKNKIHFDLNYQLNISSLFSIVYLL